MAGWAWAVFVGVSVINDDSTRQGIMLRAIKSLRMFIDHLLPGYSRVITYQVSRNFQPIVYHLKAVKRVAN